MTTVRKTLFMIISPCLNSAILAKYPSSTPRGEPLKLIKRTNEICYCIPTLSSKTQVCNSYFHFVVLQRTARSYFKVHAAGAARLLV